MASKGSGKKYHVNDRGEIGRCEANIRACRFGTQAYTEEEVRALYEKEGKDVCEMVSPARSTWLVPVRIVLREINTATVFVDAWDPEIPISYPARELPEDVSTRLRSGEPLVVAEARVDLSAEKPGEVVGKIVRSLPVPSDKELGF